MCVVEGKTVPVGLTSVHHRSHMEYHGIQTQGTQQHTQTTQVQKHNRRQMATSVQLCNTHSEQRRKKIIRKKEDYLKIGGKMYFKITDVLSQKKILPRKWARRSGVRPPAGTTASSLLQNIQTALGPTEIPM